MTITYQDVLEARREAQATLDNADQVVRHAASLIKGRLRAADCWTDDLRALKAELKNFNANTGKWSDPK